MLYLAVKALLSGLIVAAASEAAKSNFLLGALILSLPIVSVLAFVWLWRDTADNDAIATLALSTFWFVLASLPLFPILWVILKKWLRILARTRDGVRVYHAPLHRYVVGVGQSWLHALNFQRNG